MKSELYQAIRTQIETNVTEIKHVRLFNNQFVNSNNDNAGNVESAFPYPCVFIEFSDLTFKTLGRGYQEVDPTVTLHIGFETYNGAYNTGTPNGDDDLLHLTLVEKINTFIHKFQPPKFTQMARVAERMDVNHNNIIVFEIDYKYSGIDTSCDIDRNKQQVQVTLDLTKQVNITNFEIRTA